MANKYSKYYTPLPVARQLMGLVQFKDHCNVVDICCGSCNLLSAAREQNKKLDYLGVDIDPVETPDFRIIKDDGRVFARKHPKQFDYALANPPFGNSGKDSLAESLFVGDYVGINSSRLEIEMLVANLLLLKKDGVLLIILPSTTVDGTSTINIRRTIAAKHHIHSIINMPLNAFCPHRIKCSAIIIEKRKNNGGVATQTYSMNSDYLLTKTGAINHKDIAAGNWTKTTAKTKPPFSIHQGKIPSQMFSETGEEVLHSGKFATNWMPSVRFAQIPEQTTTMIYAEPGDILISRIGASAGQKMLYSGPVKLISDCLLIVKKPTTEEARNILQMDMGKLVKGLSTPHITATNIYEQYCSLYMD